MQLRIQETSDVCAHFTQRFVVLELKKILSNSKITGNNQYHQEARHG